MTTTQSKNMLADIHNEHYEAAFNRQDLNAGTMIFVEGREAESLNGLWRFTEDQYDRGLQGRWYQPPVLHSAEHRRPHDYEPDSGDEMPVPSCWNVCRPEYFYYEGSAWYARHFSYRARTDGERLFLRIGAAAYDAKVFLNAQFLGNHAGASTPFFVELTDHLQDDNLLQVCVNNTRTADRVPMRNTDWFNYGGLYRDVALFRLPAEFIKEVQVHLIPNDTYNQIAVRIRVSDDTAADSVQLRIPELGVDAILPLEKGIAEATLTASPELWSPESPTLYELTVQFRDDCVSDRVGFRQIQVRGTEILLNGRPIFLRGISVHEDDRQLGKATSETDIRRRYAHAKELGCNFLRLAHYPHHELAAKIADEVGLLLWEEIPVYWSIAFDNPATYQDAENQLLELIQRDFNRASVIIWAVGNETPDTDARLQFMGDLARAAKRIDPGRLVSAACLRNQTENRIADRLTDVLDVIGLNQYYGWYSAKYENLTALLENSQPGKPVIISECGAGALAGYHGTQTDVFSEEYMAEVYRRQLDILTQFSYIRGFSPWILYDFRSPRRKNHFQQGYNLKGLIDSDKTTKKLAFYVLQDCYLRMQKL